MDKESQRQRARENRDDCMIRSVDEATRTVTLSFSSEEPCQRWWGTEILDHSPEAVNLDRLRTLGVVLWNHNADMPIGKIIKADISNHRGEATVAFDSDPESEKIWRKITSGTLRGASVGYRIMNWEVVEKGEKSTCGRFAGPCEIARRWEPLEISIVSVPADATVGVGRSEEGEGNPLRAINEGREIELPEKGDARNDGAVAAAIAAERARVQEITTMCRDFGIDPEVYISSGTSIDDARKSVLNELRSKMAANAAKIDVVKEERDKILPAIRDGMALRAGVKIDKPADGANDFRHMTAVEVAKECLIRAGLPHRGDVYDVVGRAMTTSDFPMLLGHVAELSLMQGWNSVPETWPIWVATGSVSDFNKRQVARPGEHRDDLDMIPEGGEYQFTERGETFEEYQIATYGKMSAITRQAIINDSLGALSDEFAMHGEAAARKLGDLVYSVLITNPKMADDKNLFHAAHGNLATVCGVPSGDYEATLTLLDTAFTSMRSQKDIGGKRRIGATPRFMIVPQALDMATRRFFGASQIPLHMTGSNTSPIGLGANPFAGAVQVITEPRLDDASATAWYLAADKGKTVKIWFLNGVQTPYLERREGWNRDGVEFKVRIDAGAKAIDYRGLYKNPGTN